MERKPIRDRWNFPRARCTCGLGFMSLKALLLHRPKCLARVCTPTPARGKKPKEAH
jgi:hypothetical protein